MSIPPTVNNAQVILQGANAGTGTSGATNVPAGIMALPHGTLLRGQVAQIDPRTGVVVLRTPKGDLSLKSELSLERGNEVVLRLDTASTGLKARIISVDGLTPQELEYTQSRIAASVSENIDALVETPELNVAKPPPPVRLPPGTPLAVEDIIDIPVMEDGLPAPLPAPVLRAALLSRAVELPQLLRQLPATIPLPPQRLEAGATISITVVMESIQLPEETAPLMPSAMLTATATPADPAQPLSPNTAPNSSTPAPLPTTSTPFPAGGVARVITVPGGGYAPNPLAHSTIGYSVTLPNVTTLPAAVTTTTPLATPTTPTENPPSALSASLGNVLADVPATAGTPISTLTPPLVTPTALPEAAPLKTPTVIPTTVLPEEVITTPPASDALPDTPATVPTNQPTAPVASKPALPSAPTSTPLTTTAIPTLTLNPTPVATLPALPLPTDTTVPDKLIAQGILPAQVIGTEQSGETVLKTPFGMLKLELVTPNRHPLILPPETKLNLQLIALESGMMEIGGMAEGAPSSTASLAQLAGHWHGLEDAVSLLQQTHPLIAQHLLQNIIPQPGPKMAKDVLFFLLGLKSGDATNWLDKNTMEALEQQNRGDLVRKLSAEFGTLKQAFVEPSNPNWQSVFVPVQYQGEWQQARLYIKKDKPESAANKDDQASTRFIMEVELSRMGAMQFDGFVKKHAQSTQFDLVIRSAIALPTQDQQAIRQIFTDASQLTGFKGGLSFQVGQPFPIQPLEELLKSDRNVIA